MGVKRIRESWGRCLKTKNGESEPMGGKTQEKEVGWVEWECAFLCTAWGVIAKVCRSQVKRTHLLGGRRGGGGCKITLWDSNGPLYTHWSESRSLKCEFILIFRFGRGRGFFRGTFWCGEIHCELTLIVRFGGGRGFFEGTFWCGEIDSVHSVYSGRVGRRRAASERMWVMAVNG